jgi:hypothetical protein
MTLGLMMLTNAVAPADIRFPVGTFARLPDGLPRDWADQECGLYI